MKINYTAIFCFFIFSGFAYSQSIKLLSPNGGLNWEVNTEHVITWKSEDISNIKIEYSTNNGISWNLVSNSFPAFVGNYSWFIPQISSDQALLRISDVNNYSISDSGSFTLIPFSSTEQNIKQENINSTLGTTSNPSNITSPSTGESWRVGSAVDIIWDNGGGSISDVQVQYSTDGGSSWTTIISSTPNDGSYTWTNIPNTSTSTAKIRLVEPGNSSNVYATSGTFTIVPISPNITHFPVRILPLGNSITFGINKDIQTSTNFFTGDLAGYEYPLWNLLRADNYDFDFIGSEFSGYNKFPDYQNGGFPGVTISQLTNILETGENSKFSPADIITSPNAYLNVYTPDVVLLHIGTNIGGTAAAETSALSTLLDDIFNTSYNSNANSTWVILALVLNSDDSNSSYYQTLNNEIESMANSRINNNDDRILIVNMYDIPGFNYTTGGDLSDNVHPNYSGYNLMAGVWYDALKIILPAGTPTGPNFSESNIDTVAYVGIPFNYQAVAKGVGAPTYSISTSESATINQYTGKIDWTPSAVGEVSMTITASNGVSSDANQNLTIHVLQEPSIPNDLVSYWRFDENKSSGPFIDEYNVNNGHTKNSLTYTTGQANGAYTFNGTDKVNVLDQTDLDFQSGTSFTVEAWINVSGGTGNRAVVGKYGKLNGESFWWLGINGSGEATFVVSQYNGSRTTTTATGPVVGSGWHHLVGVKNGSSNIKVYLDDGAATSASLGGLSTAFVSYRPLNIGHLYNNYLFNGSIDEVAIYNGVLSDATILDQYNRGIDYNEGYFDIHSSSMAFLQGPYSGGSMSTALNSGGYLPLSQPYDNSPWNYYGDEKVSSQDFFINHPSIVDWVLVQLRTGSTPATATTVVAQRAAFLKSDGTIVDLDGTSSLDFNGILPGNYYIVVGHRNHLAMMSSNPVSLPNSSAYDFTVSGSAYGTNPEATLNDGKLGMWTGDANADGLITGTDFNVFNPKFINAATGYEPSDWNLDGQVTGTDFNLFNPNFTNARSSQVP